MSNRSYVAAFLGLLLSPAMAAEVLVEAEGFADKGGWVVDQQFIQQMGSSYLLAHGMGKPVDDAVTTVAFPVAGKYRVWVRTKNWVPGAWEAPGRFQLKVGSHLLPVEFGTKEGWGWQGGGMVEVLNKPTPVRLVDLTGFEGRCDAIYFSTEPDAVPPDPAKRKPKTPTEVMKFDLVVVGGGIAGCGAALAAERQGLNVALIHDRPRLGGNASDEVRVHTLGIHGKAKDILSGLDTGHWKNGSAEAVGDTDKRHKTMEASGVRLFLPWRAYGVEMDGNRIKSVDARHIAKDKTIRLEAPVFIDCTGDGWIGYWAGADFRYGRESRNEFDEGWGKHGGLWSPESPDNWVMGSSVLWNSQRLAGPSTFPDVPWAMDVAGNHSAINGEWQWEYSNNDLNQIDDAEEIRDHMFRAIYGSFHNAKKNPEHANVALKWVAYIAGRRESRRLMGDYVYTMKDVTEQRQFPDMVVTEKRAIDVHYQEKLKGKEVDFLSEAFFLRGGNYYIPFRCLYSRNIENLMMAGRCFSCSHVGLGGPRVMRTTGQMGVATGNAAALCIEHNTTPRGVYENHLAELRKLCGYGD